MREYRLNGFADYLIDGLMPLLTEFHAAPFSRLRKEVEIVNKLGLHARPAALFVRCVIRFNSCDARIRYLIRPAPLSMAIEHFFISCVVHHIAPHTC